MGKRLHLYLAGCNSSLFVHFVLRRIRLHEVDLVFQVLEVFLILSLWESKDTGEQLETSFRTEPLKSTPTLGFRPVRSQLETGGIAKMSISLTEIWTIRTGLENNRKGTDFAAHWGRALESQSRWMKEIKSLSVINAQFCSAGKNKLKRAFLTHAKGIL